MDVRGYLLMKFFCVGLSRTGTTSFHTAMQMLGYKSAHWVPHKFSDIIKGENTNPNWKRFDHIDALSDIPAATFHKEITKAYPKAKIILTKRNEKDWLKSIKFHLIKFKKYQYKNPEMYAEAIELHKFVYGNENYHEFMYLKRFKEHNKTIQKLYPNCLVLDICEGDGWEKLCPFVGKKVPKQRFPERNVTSRFYL